MNLALWLERVGLSHGDRPALGVGARVVRNYAEVAGRVARLAASLRQRFGLVPGERVAIVAKNSPDYLELMFGIWHAGLAAVPANAKLHGRELAYILEHSGARVCFASHGLDSEIGPHAPATLERLITIGSAEYEALFAADPIGAWPCQGDDLAWLFYTSGTTGRPKGAMLTHGVLAAASYAYAAEVDPIAPRRCAPARGADEPWFGRLHDGECGAARHQRHAGIERVRRRRRCSACSMRGRAPRCSPRRPW